MTTNATLLIDSHHGVYIPKFFAESEHGKLLTDNERKELSNPESEHYWDTWDDVLNSTFTINGVECILWHDEDLWAIPTTEIDEIPEY